MTDPALDPPINTLKPVAPDLWIVDGPIVRMAAGLGTSAPFPTRMTVSRLPEGALWCHSPVARMRALFTAIDALGPVAHLVSSNKLHYAHLAAWKRRYPAAVAWASPGVRERAAGRRIEVRFDAEMGDAPPSAWAETIDQPSFKGSRAIEEVVFFHRPSATFVLADLIENFEAQRLDAPMRWIACFGGLLAPTGKMPLDLRLTYLGHRAEARACLQRMLAWHPQRIILAHGRCFMEWGEAELRRAFAWLGTA